MEKIPNDYTEIEEVMSNFDHEIDLDIKEQLIKEEKVFSTYPGWNFYGRVWFDNISKQFKCEIWQFESHINTIIANDLKDIMTQTSEIYGHE